MNLEIVTTADGSTTLYNPELNEHYHSQRGAQGESEHVYIQAGLRPLLEAGQKHIKILEIGTGTGLNVLLTLREAAANPSVQIEYHTLEPFPLSADVAAGLHFPLLDEAPELVPILPIIHKHWNNKKLLPNYDVHKYYVGLLDFAACQNFDLVYFSAFGPKKQPDLWTIEVFTHLRTLLKPNACLVTYASQGQARRNMQAAGFEVFKLKGALGKNEMIRAFAKAL
ncbi:tRNA U34 5-methylaminomethyl-2-thiouridine-forming methyltransferase MnmC [Flexibacter flexilis DSM 6793]|uniref:tRNA U34 5-methylaminomethyl-2-thiouridine-forming methyltransferase MnmC n=1 Tax=Flexibacter flexilis DSM 6793 TaxID=927664 RepID=A0A1I1LXQ4_9BACT|nr:tRNA (5-methylaminomethyl-2-thiouridine)(34)-methyltransferase MnmD [Flexibacter flexilis]SFC74240.1 tRNA U34 5-methylaminomethyl-2-thiouridine-forming methyltransferase MnmC [Flexibacter flexilis DSM 6793]